MNITQIESFGKCLLKGLFTKIWTEYKEAIQDGAVLRREERGNTHTPPEGVVTSCERGREILRERERELCAKGRSSTKVDTEERDPG